MISVEELQTLFPDIWRSLSYTFGGKDGIPCLFATASFAKKVMRFVVVDRNDQIIECLSTQLVDFYKMMENNHDSIEKSFGTLVLVSREPIDKAWNEYNFIENLLVKLHAIDPCKWPEGKTKNTNDQDFEFYWNGVSWFPVLLHADHQVCIRRSQFLTIGFQLGIVFDYNKIERHFFYENMRKSIHLKISNAYSSNLPYYLSSKSSGKNICQYAGLDMHEYDVSYKYPILDY